MQTEQKRQNEEAKLYPQQADAADAAAAAKEQEEVAFAASPMLMVGGTDGSGTRSVVDLLENLGVMMAVDDEGTMDVHGQEMEGGWPPIVDEVG